MAVTIDSVRLRWAVPTSVNDALLTILLAEAVNQISPQQALFAQHYETALTALAAHKAWRFAQMRASGDGSGQQKTSESWVRRSESREGLSTASVSDGDLSDYSKTAAGSQYLRIIKMRGRRRMPLVTG